VPVLRSYCGAALQSVSRPPHPHPFETRNSHYEEFVSVSPTHACNSLYVELDVPARDGGGRQIGVVTWQVFVVVSRMCECAVLWGCRAMRGPRGGRDAGCIDKKGHDS
jgi:hypothetical protein